MAPALLVVAAAAGGCVPLPPPTVQAQIRATWSRPRGYAGADAVTIPLTRAADNKLYFSLLVDGHPLPVAIDTGARTVLDRDTMRALGVPSYPVEETYYGFGGRVHVRVGYVNEIDLGGLKIEGLSVVMIDLTDLRASQQRGSLPAISGLVGSDLLNLLSARIDYDKLTLTLNKPRGAGAPAR
jgi:predicted aspartyl protease